MKCDVIEAKIERTLRSGAEFVSSTEGAESYVGNCYLKQHSEVFYFDVVYSFDLKSNLVGSQTVKNERLTHLLPHVQLI